MNMHSVRSFIIGLLVSILFLASFFLGAIADRVFVLKPLDFLLNRSGRLVQNQQQRPLPNLRELLTDETYLVATVAENTSDSVVTVAVRRQEQQLNPFGFFGFGFGFPSGEVQEVQRDIGSGFVVEGNLVVTNKHVVADASAAYLIIDNNDNEYQVVNIYRDPANDLAILRVENINLPALTLGDSDQIRVGEPAIAIGTALGEFRHTVTSGVISGLGRGIQAGSAFSQLETLEGVIQTDAAINPGNSGGPLLNAVGEVIGVNVAVTQGAENIGFAIPINVVKASLNNFNETGQFDRPFLGVRYQLISEQAAVANEIPQGAYIAEVVAGSVAAEAGIEPGDVLLSIDGERLNEERDLAVIINNKRVGQRVELEYWSEGSRLRATVTLRASE